MVRSPNPISTPVFPPAHRTPKEIYRSGIAALRQQLEPVDSGDYTAECQAQDDEPSIADLCAAIRSTTQVTLPDIRRLDP